MSPSTLIRVNDSTKNRLHSLQNPGESMDDTIQRMLSALEIKTPTIMKVVVR